MEVLIKSLRPNPFRNIKRYPIIREKVDALKCSIVDTTFWDNLLVRRMPSGKEYEIPFGHHRKVALEELLKEKKISDSIDVHVRDLTDTNMAQMMAQENMEEWGSSATVEQETVRAIIEGYAAGKITLPTPNGKTPQKQIRYAPRFSIDVRLPANAHPYTSDSLAEFLRWKEYKVEAALGALAMIEDDLASDDDFNKLDTTNASVIAQQGRRVFKATGDRDKAKKIVKELANEVRAGDLSRRGIKQATDVKSGAYDTKIYAQTKPRKIPDIDEFALSIANSIDALFLARRPQFDAIIKHQTSLKLDSRKYLLRSLKSAVDIYNALNSQSPMRGQKQLS